MRRKKRLQLLHYNLNMLIFFSFHFILFIASTVFQPYRIIT